MVSDCVIIYRMINDRRMDQYWRDLRTDDFGGSDIAVFGIAYDGHCSASRGTAKAPEVMRRLSAYLPPYTVSGKRIEASVYDMGDIKEYDYGKVESFAAKAFQKKLTVILGGDHSVSILTQKAFEKFFKGKTGIVHIDAHADICDVYDGSRYSHACVLRRALENGYSDDDIVMVGIRSYEDREIEYLAGSSIEIYSAERATSDGVEAVTRKIVDKFRGYDGVYVSFDIDAVDPSFAPGTGTPEAFGLQSSYVLSLLKGIFASLPVKALDLVEISPPADVNDITSWLGLKYLLEIFGIVRSDNK